MLRCKFVVKALFHPLHEHFSRCYVDWYLGIFINYNSHHPKNIILNTAKNEYKRALKNCSNDELKSAAFKRISYTLLDNNFPKDVIDSILEDVIKQEYAEKEAKEKFESKSIISLPYISEQCVRKVKQEVRKRGLQDVVRVVGGVSRPCAPLRPCVKTGSA